MSQPIPIEEVTIPATAAGADLATFQQVTDLRNSIVAEFLGDATDANTVEEVLSGLVNQTYERNRLFVVRHEGAIVASAWLAWAVEPDTRVSWIEVNVHPDHRNQGIGSALLDHLEAISREKRLPIAQGGGKHHPNLPGPRLESPTGFGELPRKDPVVRFLLNRGYTLEQVYRISLLRLPVAPETLSSLLVEAQVHAGSDYRIQRWNGSTPLQWQDDVALVMNRMSTDAPAGNLEIEEEPWDADRVRQRDESRATAGRIGLVAAVEHIPTGRLVAYSGMSISRDDRSRPAHQGDTLVMKEHRGHRLGTIVKIVNIQQLAEISPETPCIITDNAEENLPMLSVNEAVGFEAVAYSGAWKKVLYEEA
jgi:GNAT superfamily N-acetyltransferase/RimJ/RimL family protein N-acetyltransferase